MDFILDRGWSRRLWRSEFRLIESYSSIGGLGKSGSRPLQLLDSRDLTED